MDVLQRGDIKDEICYCGALKSQHDGINGRGSYMKNWCKKFTYKPKMNAYMRKYRKEHPEYIERELARTRKPNGYIARRKPKEAKENEM